MKLFFVVCWLVLFSGCNHCRASYSPIGEWELYVNRDEKRELATPATNLTIHADGRFSASTREGGHDETNSGNWSRQGETVVFQDRAGEHRAIMEGGDKMILTEQPFQKFGIQMLFMRKSRNAADE